ncbi:PRODH isoform 6 [Pongo abelii]|uniref:Proline dehydrogenase n=1 Tax=Pongo abelii TaxID=9601 RepID=A0A2J8R031_PONAB|nr:PRODH isoform 6 [Pongo abelii]
MALRRALPALRPYLPRFVPLSTAPASREQPAAGPAAVPGGGSATAVRPPVPAVDFGNAQEAYRSRRTWELARSLLVLRLCAWPALLARHEQLLYVSRKLLGQRLFNKLMKMTFYGHFVAGEDQESIQPLLQHNRAFGVGAILDYAVEEDLSPEEAEHKEMESCTSAAERDGSGTNKRDKQYQAHRAFGDRRNGVISARTYFYANEAKCDSHMETFLRCIEASGRVSDDGFIAIKLTALGRPQFLTGQLEPLLSRFTEEEELQMTRMLQRMDVLAKDAYDNVTLDVELARREGWCFGAKLVRGAYLAQERARAAEIGYEDPINPTYEATNAMYHRCLDYVLEELKHNAKAKMMVASHNEDTVRFALHRMEELGLHPADHQVYFGQLLGMCDQISFPLGQAGYPVYKYVPYGPVMEVLPYLSRRALENSSLMKGAHRERQLMWVELLRRLRTCSFFHRPT